MASAEKIAGKGNVAADLNRPRVVVLSCDNMTPGKGDKDIDGPADTLGERFLWRLFDGAPKLWSEYRADAANKSRLAEAIDVVGRPVLILVDEVMDYIRKAAAAEQTDLVVQDMAFLRALLDTVNDVPNCAMVLVMIASDKENIVLNDLGERCRAELEDLLVRNARTATVTTANDFAEIIRRHLFEKPPPAEVLSATARQWLDHLDADWRRVLSRSGLANDAEFRAKVTRSYPFHPSLIDLAENEWSLSTGFQRVRSTIQIFAATGGDVGREVDDHLADGGADGPDDPVGGLWGARTRPRCLTWALTRSRCPAMWKPPTWTRQGLRPGGSPD